MQSKYFFSKLVPSKTVMIGLCFVSGCIMHVTPARGTNLLTTQSAAERGDISSELAMGDAYFDGQGVPEDKVQAAYWYEKAANAGDASAQNQIGYFYQVGIGVSVDTSRAVHWFQLSAANGNADAKVNLGVAYFWGTGVNRDPQMAERLFHEAALHGNSSAMTNLGDMYYIGDGVPRNEQLAKSWYEEAIKRHDSLAEYRMGILLSASDAGLRDLQRAAMLFRESSADGFVPSMHALGLLLVNYPEIGRSHQEALHALCDAASAGMWKSSVILGLLARDGKWMPKDPAVAYFYLRVAESQGGSSATQVVENEIDKLSKLLHPDQFIQIDEHARTWARMHNVSLIRIYRNRGKQKHFPLYGQVTAIDGVHAGALMPSRPPAASKQNYSDLAATPNCSAINLAQNDAATRSVYGTQID